MKAIKMNLNEILNKRLLIVSGKGGVGKTSVAASLGLIASKLGKKTLIAEVNSAERIAQLFGTKKIGYKETAIAENLHAINIDPRSAFEEYIIEQIHSKRIYSLVFENKFVRSFLDATPGLNELLEIGKIWSLADRDQNPSGTGPKYDLVIVDAPATGHGLAFLEVPQVVTKAIRVGPLKTKAALISKLIQDKDKTLLIITTLAEEMPVNETLEMIQKAKKDVNVATGPVVVNAVFSTVFPENEAAEVKEILEKNNDDGAIQQIENVLHLFQKRASLHHFYINKLQLSLEDKTLAILPFLFKSHFGQEAIEELSIHLKESLENPEVEIEKWRKK